MDDGSYADSKVKGALDAIGDRLGRLGAAYRFSSTRRVETGLANAVRHSLLYRWLTKEPDPEVVVIDLRETYTVGPVIAVLDWLVRVGAHSRLVSGGRYVLRTATKPLVSSPVRTVGLVVLAAVAVNALLTQVTGGLTANGLGLRLLVGAGGLLATRSDASLEELRDSRVGRLAAALLAPPDPPERND